ncbi:MAG: hypothetical protein JNL60_16545, partial [Bacteroidia bacterium]|nr:hypothetical protein [Bacteroidia bacterium]
MKKLTQLTFVFLLSLSLSNYAQDTKNKTNASTSQPGLVSPSSSMKAKESYIKNKEYLLGNSKLRMDSPEDSLYGFDEAAIKSELLAQGIPGWEIYSYINLQKRNFIDKKYSIGSQSKLTSVITGPLNTGGSANKPIGGGNTINNAPCVNEDFESTTPGLYTTGNGVSGWSISSRVNDAACSPNNWTSGSNEFEIVTTPISGYPGAGLIPNSPLGGTNVARLNNYGAGSNNVSMTRMTQTFPVTSQNAVFQFAYAGYWEDGTGHACCSSSPASWQQAGFVVQMYACNGATLGCSNIYLSPGCNTGATFTTSNGAAWTNWQVKIIDLTPYIGSCVTIEFITSDCSLTGHWGSTLIDCKCGGPVICNTCSIGGPTTFIPGQTVSYCSGSNVAQISAPLGYATYSWSGPSTLAAGQSTLATITITNPVLGSVWTVTMVTPTGCVFTTTNALNPTTVAIAAALTNSSCIGGASGSATVFGTGSGNGYTATWTAASNNSVVGTGTVVNNLAPGVYSVTVAGLGTSCGTAMTTVTVGARPLGIIPLSVSYCGNVAFLNTFGGTNFQWYDSNLSPIPGSGGGTLAAYTVTAPSNGANYYLRYTTNQGCNDSLKYTLYQTTPGLLNVLNVSPICVGGTNGTATIALSPATGAPTGMNTYSVFATGSTSPYTATLSGTSAITFTTSNMSAGSYGVYAFDGACQYTTSFNVTPLVWNYSLTPTTASTCPGGNVSANVVHQFVATPGQYTYSWSPNTWLFGGIATQSSVLISPVCSGSPSASIIYTVTVTPTLVNCPIVKTLTISTFCPKTPTVALIPNLCNNSALYTVSTTPSNCTFSMAGSSNAISNAGVIAPGNASIGLNNFTAINTSYTCAATQTANFHVSQFVSSNLTTPTITPLCITSPNYNLNNIVVNAGGTWLKGVPPPSGVSNPTSVIAGGQLNPSTYNFPSSPT